MIPVSLTKEFHMYLRFQSTLLINIVLFSLMDSSAVKFVTGEL